MLGGVYGFGGTGLLMLLYGFPAMSGILYGLLLLIVILEPTEMSLDLFWSPYG